MLLFITMILIVLYTYKISTVNAATILPPQMKIDTPSMSQVISGTSFDIRGWSLNATGVKEIKIYIDSVYTGNATSGLDRSDVNVAFPGYINGNKSGFTYHVDINKIMAGSRNIKIYSYGNNGTSQMISINVTIKKKPPIMSIESPTNNEIIRGYNFNVSGWSLNPSGIVTVAIYIDNKFLKNASYGSVRGDVNTAYPGYPNGTLGGYNSNVDVKEIAPGIHKLSVVSIGRDGSKIQNDKAIIINKKQPKLNIDTPINNFTTTKKDIYISGWALNDSGIKEIQYYLNGKLVGLSTTGLQRNDVNAAFPGYLNGINSGFNFTFNALKYVPIGRNNATLKIVAIGKDSTTSTVNRNLILNKLPEILSIDTPSNNATIKSNINISGWALNASGVTAVNVYLDNVLRGKASYGISRPDVNAAFQGYTDGDKSGLNFNLDISKTTPGNHSIKVEMVGNDGRIISKIIAIKIYGIVEYHSYNSTLDKMVSIQLTAKAVYQNTKTWTWDPASASMIREYVDPTNITNDAYRKYEFLELSYNNGSSVVDLNNVLKGKGILDNLGQTFIASAKANNINPIYLISHAILETGNGTSALAKGILVTSVDGKAVTPKIVYNLFGIGAYDSNANKYGSEYAYKQGWFSIAQAINGGAYFISSGYINNANTNQDTLYKMRWNPASPGTHQYATDIRWAYNQILNIKILIEKCPNTILYFDIPILK
ncbi:Ig-like domain-containing protein [Clostridium lacusfryxellense]|uniref:Ig-like domain-containing protein n=1 Tax=Clostridium lacusfryxellense TaxID=205328 RepID=UPI001C0E7663|nr:Ig-like domain-containing protein [Clostridium lacusfryxellense]MBU3111009.1 glucosaminidase domain-containing protein [Clostridium lacusfryxellense]